MVRVETRTGHVATVETGTCQFGNSRDRYRSVITGQTFTGQ